MARRLEADDEVRRFLPVWLGAAPYTFWWRARYVAYGLWFSLFCGVLLFEAITPLSISVPPLWEFSLTVLATTAIMGAVDYDKPVRAVLKNVYNLARSPRAEDPAPIVVRPSLGALVKITKDPL